MRGPDPWILMGFHVPGWEEGTPGGQGLGALTRASSTSPISSMR